MSQLEKGSTSDSKNSHVLVSHEPPPRSSYGPLTLEQDQVKTSCVQTLSKVFSDGAPTYRGVGFVPRLDPTLIVSLACLGESNVGRVMHQVGEEILSLCLDENSSINTDQHLRVLLQSTIIDIGSRVDHIIHQQIYGTLVNGGVVEGYTLEPIVYNDEWEDGARMAGEASGDENVLPFRREERDAA
ncbi:hypothetical protein KAZ92_01420 [Candidatus Gracilibacteria bacterium]|nr:hypothetical protein [Candidatus Gracilibacteria bacterium]